MREKGRTGRNKRRTGHRPALSPLPRILLVEDHPTLAALRCAMLRKQKYAVVWTGDGQEACRLLETEPFNLVVTDSVLPSGSGWEVARAAKKRGLPVILSTGWPLPPQARGVDYILRKPSSLSQFLGLIQRALGKAESKPDEARG